MKFMLGISHARDRQKPSFTLMLCCFISFVRPAGRTHLERVQASLHQYHPRHSREGGNDVLEQGKIQGHVDQVVRETVELKVPKLRPATFETAIIERYPIPLHSQ